MRSIPFPTDPTRGSLAHIGHAAHPLAMDWWASDYRGVRAITARARRQHIADQAVARRFRGRRHMLAMVFPVYPGPRDS
jgi:hypothetical protein